MLSLLTWESPHLWPLAAALGLALFIAVLWFYPAQVRPLGGVTRWLLPLLRFAAVLALAASLLKPVIVQPKTAEEWGTTLVLIDNSRSMGVHDVGRKPAEWVALAAAIGALPPGTRGGPASTLNSELRVLGTMAQDVIAAHSDLEYARVSGRGISDARKRLADVVARYTGEAKLLASRAGSMPNEGELRQRLSELDAVPEADARDAWAHDVRPKIGRALAAVSAFQAASDEQLYAANAEVRKACEALSGQSRLALVEESLLRPATGLLARLGGQMPVAGMTVSESAVPIELIPGGKPPAALTIEPSGRTSNLTGALPSALRQFGGRPVRAVILFSDGRQVGGDPDLPAGLTPSGVPVFAIGVAPSQTPDVSFADMTLPASAYAGETIRVTAELRHPGIPAVAGEVHLKMGGAQQTAKPEPEENRLLVHFDVKLEPQNPPAASELLELSIPPVPGEATPDNNRARRWIKVLSHRLKVGVYTGSPGWDYQYLRAALSRAVSVELASGALDPEKPKLSLTSGQILDQDVLILNDVPVGALDEAQWAAVDRLVAERGGSVIIIAGQSFPPSDYGQQPLAANLLPFRGGLRPAWREWPGEQPSFRFTPTPEAADALRLGEGDAGLRRWQQLSGVYRYLRVPKDKNDLKPGVQPLLIESITGTPVLTERRLGAGRVFFMGINETWRWRFKVGERDQDRFWRQLIRYATGEPYAARQGPLSLDVSQSGASAGEAVRVRARILGAKSPAAGAASCDVQVIRGGKLVRTEKLPAAGEPGSGRYEMDLSDLPGGDYLLQLSGLATDGKPVHVQVQLHVSASYEEEMRDVSGDETRLRRLAESSGGEFLTLDQLDQLPAKLAATGQGATRLTRRRLWDGPYLFAFVVACFGMEWGLRKRFGLA